MKYLNPALAVALAALLVLAPVATADETGSPEAKLIETKAGAVVSVKFVLQISYNFQGQQGEQEQNGSVTGIMVDPSGLVMVPAAVFDLGQGRRPRRGMSLSSKPTNLRVVFPGDEKEHPAILGAKDSKFGLGFVLIKDMGDKQAATVDMSKVAEPKVGDTLYGVSRMDQGFDHAPICDSVKVTGVITKPRPMWAISGASTFVAEPLYTADGSVAGVCAIQSGVGDDASAMPFLLPLKIVSPVVSRAKKESERALEEILEAEAEAEEEDADEDEDDDDDEGGDDGDDDGGDK